MLDKPYLPDDQIVTVLRKAYGLPFIQVEFLPLGADSHTTLYRAWLEGGQLYFVRLRSGRFDPLQLELLHFLRANGLQQVIAPLPARSGELWTDLAAYKLMLYPYIAGRNVYQAGLTDAQWIEFGAALKRLHSLHLPLEMAMRLRRERFDPAFRTSLREILERAASTTPADPLARACASLLADHESELQALLARTQQLAERLQGQPHKLVLCHADLHAGNLLVEDDGTLHLIDWDEILLAPKERDLMYPGGGLLGGWRPPAEETRLFYQGYGPVQIDPAALAYYRYERIIQDLAIYAGELLAVQGSLEGRQLSYQYLRSNFDPGGVLEVARQFDQAPGRGEAWKLPTRPSPPLTSDN